MRKYGNTEDELFDYYERAQSDLETITLSDERLRELHKEYEQAEKHTQALAQELSEARKSGKNFCRKAKSGAFFFGYAWPPFFGAAVNLRPKSLWL